MSASFPNKMSASFPNNDLRRHVLTNAQPPLKMPIYFYKLEQRLNRQESRIRHLEDQIEEAQRDNQRLKDQLTQGVPIEQVKTRSDSESNVFRISL